MAGKPKRLYNVNIIHPDKEELEFILQSFEKAEQTNKEVVLAQSYHPDGGFKQEFMTLQVAKLQHGQRLSAPFVLVYFPKEYYAAMKH